MRAVITWQCRAGLTDLSGRHEGYYISKANQTLRVPSGDKFEFLAEELINVEYSHKVPSLASSHLASNSRSEQFSEWDAFRLFVDANLRPIQRWMDPTSRYSLWLLERPPFIFPLLKSPEGVSSSSPFSVPSVAEWETLWSTWDVITMGMISPDLLYEKPIDLRHICLFYLGHIPTFLDIHLSRLLDEPHTEPDNFKVSAGRSQSLIAADLHVAYLRARNRPRRRRSGSMPRKRTPCIRATSFR